MPNRHKPLRRSILVAAIALVALLPAGLPAQTVRVKLGTVAPKGSHWHNALLRISQEWSRISNGQVKVTIYPGGVVGGENEIVRKMQRRGLDAAALSGAGLPRVDDSVECLNIPMAFGSYEEFDYVRERISPEIEKQFERQGFKILNWSDAGWVHFFTKSPARTPGEIRKLKLWTSDGDPEAERLFHRMGFNVVPLPATEVATALQTGLIEAIEVPPLFAMLDGSYKQADHMLRIRWLPLVAATVISTRTWEQIPADLRDPLLKAAQAAGEEVRADIRKAGEDAIVEMQKRGLKVVDLDPALTKTWNQEAQAAYPELRGTLAPAALFDRILSLRDQYRASSGGKAAGG